MDEVSEILNRDFTEYRHVVEFRLHNKKGNLQTLENYLTSRIKDCGGDLYIMTGNGVLTALIGSSYFVDNKQELHNKIVNYLNKSAKMRKRMYDLIITDCDDYHYEKPFDYWLSVSIYLTGVNHNFYVWRGENDEVANQMDKMKYVDMFRTTKHYSIQTELQNKKAIKKQQKEHAEKMELIKNELFIGKIKKHFTFTNNDNDYLPKKVVCDLLDLDCDSKGDIKRLNNILTEYGVKYDKLKMIKGDRGVFLGIFLK